MTAASPEDVESGAPEEQSVNIPKETLPAGISEGDTLVCTGMDDTGYTFKHQKGKSDQGESWEDETRKAMSPRSPMEGAE